MEYTFTRHFLLGVFISFIAVISFVGLANANANGFGFKKKSFHHGGGFGHHQVIKKKHAIHPRQELGLGFKPHYHGQKFGHHQQAHLGPHGVKKGFGATYQEPRYYKKVILVNKYNGNKKIVYKPVY